jgi:hypothetical protein
LLAIWGLPELAHVLILEASDVEDVAACEYLDLLTLAGGALVTGVWIVFKHLFISYLLHPTGLYYVVVQEGVNVPPASLALPLSEEDTET